MQGRPGESVSEREDRALDQYRDERLSKLENLVKGLIQDQDARAGEISQLQQMVSGIKATLEQYSQVLDGMKNLPNELMDALTKSNQAAKLYIDEKLGQTTQQPIAASGLQN